MKGVAEDFIAWREPHRVSQGLSSDFCSTSIILCNVSHTAPFIPFLGHIVTYNAFVMNMSNSVCP
jgi:hypothetical protein